MWNLTSAISADTMTRSIRMHVQSDVCTTPHAPPYWNSPSARTIWMYFHTADMSSVHSAESARSMTRLVNAHLVGNSHIAFIAHTIDYGLIFKFSVIAGRWRISWCCSRWYDSRVVISRHCNRSWCWVWLNSRHWVLSYYRCCYCRRTSCRSCTWSIFWLSMTPMTLILIYISTAFKAINLIRRTLSSRLIVEDVTAVVDTLELPWALRRGLLPPARVLLKTFWEEPFWNL